MKNDIKVIVGEHNMLKESTVMGKISEANSSFHVK